MTVDDLNTEIKEFMKVYKSTPQYGGYSRTLRRKIEGRHQVKLAFIDEMILTQALTTDPAVDKAIEDLLQKLSKL